MSDTRTLVVAIVGTGLAVITVQVAVMSMLIGGVNARIDDLRADVVRFRGEMREDAAGLRADIVQFRGEMREDVAGLRADVVRFRSEMREDVAGLRERLRAVEIGFAKVDQRLETLERAILPPAEAAGQE